MDEKSIFIRLLRFGAERELQATTLDDFKEWALSQPDIENDTCGQYQRAKVLFIRCFAKTRQPTVGLAEFVLETEYYFRLIEFQELEESRKASSEANLHSQVAIAFSIVAIAASLIVGAIQLNSTIKIDFDQVSRMETKKFPVSQKIESEQLSQVISALKQSNINTAELARIIQEQNSKQIVNGEVKKK
jgi:hypothetical protein